MLQQGVTMDFFQRTSEHATDLSMTEKELFNFATRKPTDRKIYDYTGVCLDKLVLFPLQQFYVLPAS